MESPIEPPKEHSLADTLTLVLSDFSPPELKDNIVLLEAPIFVVVCYNINTTVIQSLIQF